jgi:hypothetical protein
MRRNPRDSFNEFHSKSQELTAVAERESSRRREVVGGGCAEQASETPSATALSLTQLRAVVGFAWPMRRYLPRTERDELAAIRRRVRFAAWPPDDAIAREWQERLGRLIRLGAAGWLQDQRDGGAGR